MSRRFAIRPSCASALRTLVSAVVAPSGDLLTAHCECYPLRDCSCPPSSAPLFTLSHIGATRVACNMRFTESDTDTSFFPSFRLASPLTPRALHHALHETFVSPICAMCPR